MSLSSIALVLVVHLLFLCDLGSSLKCYSCKSRLGMGLDCEKPSLLPERQHFDCNYENSLCVKYIIRDPHGEMLHRHCADYRICSNLARETALIPYTAVLECNTCRDQDLCNTATKLSSHVVLSIVIFSVTITYFLT